MIKEYLVLSRSNGTTRTGSPYAILKVADLIETINISVWDLQPTAEPKVGQLVSFYAIKDNAGKKYCSVNDMRVGAMTFLDHLLYNLLFRPIRRDVWDKPIEKLISYCSDQRLIPILRAFSAK